ncbi:MAG: hypothetical protein AUI50_06280 [Crenarchaeota archaeon 13_1_40CM_2_52_14]|nr:MAG: hypothetical protein AUI97_06810 [Crenarchaeota archaeon 13_1_40CM_3_52_17]OLD34510.1 MAG: hypothetical protein AUI50_06280 [Crenarchaeota archaeon 13_1_40CM_2_52_14]
MSKEPSAVSESSVLEGLFSGMTESYGNSCWYQSCEILNFPKEDGFGSLVLVLVMIFGNFGLRLSFET